MRIVNLIENTPGVPGCDYAHGLSFYVETKKHKLLVDAGPSEATLFNAGQLGIDLSAVDTLILSHGHYDHSGGIMAFAKLNPRASVLMQREADGDFFSEGLPENGKRQFRYIGIDKAIPSLPQLVVLDGNSTIDEELSVFTIRNPKRPRPFTNRRLFKREGDNYVLDEFVHEQYLVIREGEKSVLISGCAHNGMENILDTYRDIYGSEPDAVISGFHLMKKTAYTKEEIFEIEQTAEALKNSRTRFFTCHCTGLFAYERMKAILKDKLEYVHAGEEVLLDGQKPIRLIAFDMDGTLLNDAKEKPKEFIPWLKEHPKVRAVIASGRQYETLRRDFEEIQDELYFLADNGALVFYKGSLISIDAPEKSAVREALELIRKRMPETVVILCGAKSAYMLHASETAEKNAALYYKKLMFVTDLADMIDKDDIVKIACFFEKGNAMECIEKYDGLDESLEAMVSGDGWIDVMKRGVNKGFGIRAIQKKYGISRDESMAFGDFMNDYELLLSCRESYAMENGASELKQIAGHIAPPNNDNGVMRVLQSYPEEGFIR